MKPGYIYREPQPRSFLRSLAILGTMLLGAAIVALIFLLR
jgi:hypothetical protein